MKDANAAVAAAPHAPPDAPPRRPDPAGTAPFWQRHGSMVLALVCGMFLVMGYALEHVNGGAAGRTATVGCYLVAYVAGAWYSLGETWASLRKGALNIDFLMIVAALGAAFIDQWHEGATLLFLFSLSNALQVYALGRTRAAIRSLVALRPQTVTLLEVDAGGGEVERAVPLDEAPVGALLRLRPGERVPLDAVLVTGQTSVDESSLTGESIPVDHAPGAHLRAGTLNLTGVVVARVERPASDSTLARIIRMVEQAREEKATAQQAIDRFGAIYTWCVLLGSALIFVILWRFAGMTTHAAFYRTMVCLVVASPCALVISTPAAVLSAIGRGARLGILFKGGAHLEAAGLLRAVAIDKTGTLTVGRPRVTAVLPCAGFDADRLLSLVSAVEAHSEHPLAEAMVEEARARGLDVPAVTDAAAATGHGMEASLDGARLRVGQGTWPGDGAPLPAALAEAVARHEQEGGTVVTVARGVEYLGAVVLADTLRPDAPAAMAALRRSGVRHIALLSGDSRPVVEHVGRRVGADIMEARLKPEDKVRAVRELRERFKVVGMVGDGVNDAPALAVASVGIAMGRRGTDAALETADIVLMKDDLGRLATAVQLGRAARRIILQNLTLSLTVIVVLVTTTLASGLPLAWGVIGHEGSTLLVVLNSLRLLGFRPESLPKR